MSYPCGKGEVSAIKTLQQSKILSVVRKAMWRGCNATFDEILAATKHFFLLMYGPNKQMTMSEARYQLFKKNAKPPPLKKLPPIEENMKLYPPTS